MTAIDAAARPRLAPGARLRLDRITGKTLLLRPEQGFELHGSADAIVKLCTGERTVAQIIDHLTDQVAAATPDGMADQASQSRPDVARAGIADDVTRLLTDLARRGLIVVGDER